MEIGLLDSLPAGENARPELDRTQRTLRADDFGETGKGACRLPSLPFTCRDCGGELPTRRHRYCEDCRQRRWERNASRGRQNAAQVLAGLRAEQRDPGHGGQAAKLRGTKNAAHQRAVREWVGERPDPAIFNADILPGLRHASIGDLAAATGLSEHYCSLIRLGKKLPHPRHWDSLRAVSARVAGQR